MLVAQASKLYTSSVFLLCPLLLMVFLFVPPHGCSETPTVQIERHWENAAGNNEINPVERARSTVTKARMERYLQLKRHRYHNQARGAYGALHTSWLNAELDKRALRIGKLHLEDCVRIYRLYYSEDCFQELRTYHDDERYVFVRLGGPIYPHPNPNKSIDALEAMPFLKDYYWQRILCEGGGILAVSQVLAAEEARGRPICKWLGFNSWKEKWKAKPISERGDFLHRILPWRKLATLESVAVADPEAPHKRTNLMEDVIKEGSVDGIYYWKSFGVKSLVPQCEKHHAGCGAVLSKVLAPFSANNGSGLPSMPKATNGWSYCSYYLMSYDSYRYWIKYLEVIAAELYSNYYNMTYLEYGCPISVVNRTTNLSCYGFLLERVINVWAYTTQRPMYYVTTSGKLLANKYYHSYSSGRRQQPPAPFWLSDDDVAAIHERYRQKGLLLDWTKQFKHPIQRPPRNVTLTDLAVLKNQDEWREYGP